MQAGTPISARTTHTATLLDDGRVLVIGGFDGSSVLKSTELYDPASDTFMSGPNMQKYRAHHTATALGDGRVLVVGGMDTVPHASAEIYDPSTNAFTLVGPMSSARIYHAASRL